MINIIMKYLPTRVGIRILQILYQNQGLLLIIIKYE